MFKTPIHFVYRMTFKTLLALVLATGLVHSAFAKCRGEIPYPVVSLVEGLEVLNEDGQFVGKLGYLEAVESEDFTSVRDISGRVRPIPVIYQGKPATVQSDQVLTFRRSGRVCLTERLLVKEIREGKGDSTLQAKAIIGVTPESLLKQTDVKEPVVTFRAAPDKEAKELRKEPRFLLGYIWAVHYNPETLEYWYYIGANPSLTFDSRFKSNLESRDRKGMLGWLNADDLEIWSQRQALYPKSAQSDGVFYKDDNKTAIAAQITWKDESAPERHEAVLKPSIIRRLPEKEVYEIAFAGVPNKVSKQEQENPKPREPPSEVINDDVRRALQRLADAKGKVDVLFVVDNTESVNPYRDTIVNGIVDMEKRLSKEAKRMTITMAVYGDTFSSPETGKKWFADRMRPDKRWFATGNNKAFQFLMTGRGKVGDIPTKAKFDEAFSDNSFDDEQNDIPEMGFGALEAAVRSMAWREGSARLVVYIGDDESRPIPSMNEEQSIDAIATSLKNSRALLLPINVSGITIDDANARWIKQMEALAKAAGSKPGGGGVLGVDRTYEIGGETSDEVDKQRTRELVTSAIVTVFAVQKIGNSGIVDREVICRLAAKQQLPCIKVISVLEGLTGVRLKEFLAAQERSHQLGTGYYPIDNSEIFVALNKFETRGLGQALNNACILLQDSEQASRAIDDMTDKLVDAFLGEDRQEFGSGGDGETLPEYFARLTNLPKRYFGIFGNKTLDEFGDYIQDIAVDDKERHKAIQRELCTSAALFNQVSKELWASRDLLVSDWNSESLSWTIVPAQKPKKYTWRWSVGGGMEVNFIPEDFFPKPVDAQ